jgi:hypothetical protein
MYRRMIALAIAALLAGCSLHSEAPLEDVEKASVLFFQRLQEADYDTIYKDSARQFKQNKTRDEIIDSLKSLNSYGKFLGYQRISAGYDGDPKDKLVTAVYIISFEQRRGSLTLYFVDESGEWKFVGFAWKART